MIYISIWSYAWKKKSQFILLKIPPHLGKIHILSIEVLWRIRRKMKFITMIKPTISQIKMSHVTRKPVFEVCDKVRHKLACSGIILSRQRTTKVLMTVVCIWHKTGFLWRKMVYELEYICIMYNLHSDMSESFMLPCIWKNMDSPWTGMKAKVKKKWTKANCWLWK